MRISDWSSDVCSSDLWPQAALAGALGACFTCAALAQYPQPSMRLVSETPMAAASPAVTAEGLQDIAVDAYLYAYTMATGSASCRERVCEYVSIAVVHVSIKKIPTHCNVKRTTILLT